MDESSSNVVKYTFKADTSNVEKAVDGIGKKVGDLKQEMGDMNLKINWGEGQGTYEEYQAWFEKTTKEAEEYAKAQEEAAAASAKVESATKTVAPEIEKTGQAAEQAKFDFEEFKESMWQMTGSMHDVSKEAQAMFAAITAAEISWVSDSMSEYAKYEDALYGLMTTVDTVKGTITDAMTEVRDITADGLLSEEDAMVAMRNLTAYGYSVQEASEMIKAMTLSAEANRKEMYTVSEAVERATQGIKQESSMMMKVAGNMETASSAYDRYAASVGKTASELTQAERRQAIYNSTIEAGQKYSSQASAYQNTYSASTQRLANSLENLKASFGQAFAPMATVINNLASFVVANKEVVVVLGTFVGVVVGAGGIVWAIAKLIPMISSAIAWFSGLNVAAKGVVLGLATVAATMAAISLVSSQTAGATEDLVSGLDDGADAMEDFGVATGGAAGSVKDLNKQLDKLRRDYLEDLKQIEVRHLETIDNLTKQIKEANVSYRRAVEERNAAFEVSQAEEERAHQEKVDEIMTQIAFLQRYNNEYNRQKLSNLEFALAKENNLYKRQTEAAKEELELQNENDRKAYEEKQAALQAELDEELAFMNKHRDALKEVQDVILLDEIEALQRRYEEQKASYEEQTNLAGAAGGSIANNLADKFNEAMKNSQFSIGQAGTDAGDAFGSSFFGKVMNWFDQVLNNSVGKFLFGESAGMTADTEQKKIVEYYKSKYGNNWKSEWTRQGMGAIPAGYATGGFTGRGATDEIAGFVHKGEYVLPAQLVDQNTGTPKTLGNTIININVQGTFATSQAERRKVAEQIATALEQVKRSRLEATA